jgi:hypothetical protein
MDVLSLDVCRSTEFSVLRVVPGFLWPWKLADKLVGSLARGTKPWS